MSEAVSIRELAPDDVAGWSAQPFETLLALDADQVAEAQVKALSHRFESLRKGVSALDALATREGVDGIGSFGEAAPLLFDHRVYKSYPMSLIEKRQFDRLTRVASSG